MPIAARINEPSESHSMTNFPHLRRFVHLSSRHLGRLACLLLCNVVGIVAAEVPRTESPIIEPAVTDDDREHWSFRPIVRPEVPTTSDMAWTRNEIDHFILAKLEAKQLGPQPQAARETLIRRLSFDLLGLPPSPEQTAAFVADSSPDAYERLVDQLLGSPHYGEHWAQYWLDLARFAETDGFEHDKVRSEAWRYRDWVIDALNADMPYDRFISLQLAADEMDAEQPESRIPTAFCLSGPDMPDINSQQERRHNVLNELTSTVGSVLLGLQVGCAQCHDHKFDPVSQADFYRLRAVFEPAVQVKKDKSLDVLNEPSGEVPVSHLMLRGDWQSPGAEVPPAFPRIANASRIEIAPGSGLSTSGRRRALAAWLTRSDHPLTARVIANRLWQYHFSKGLVQTPSDFGIVGDEPTHPELLDWLATELMRQDWSWKQLHRQIVTSATYRQASRPVGSTTRDLLDEDVSQSDDSHDETQRWAHTIARDPSNLWLSRFPRRRLSGEAIRDAMLLAADSLNTEQHGPGVRPPLAPELVRSLLKNQWEVSPRAADHYRRSVYVFARRNLRYPIFDAFDRPDANASCPRRSRSTTAPQALLLLNSALALDAAQRLAGSTLVEHPDIDAAAIGTIFQRVFSRQPHDAEVSLFVSFLEQQTQALRSESRPPAALSLPLPCPTAADTYAAAALTDLCLALLNTNEFLYID